MQIIFNTRIRAGKVTTMHLGGFKEQDVRGNNDTRVTNEWTGPSC